MQLYLFALLFTAILCSKGVFGRASEWLDKQGINEAKTMDGAVPTNRVEQGRVWKLYCRWSNANRQGRAGKSVECLLVDGSMPTYRVEREEWKVYL